MRVRVAIWLAIALIGGMAQAEKNDFERALDELKAGRPEEAARLLVATVTAEPSNLGVRFWLGRAYFDMGQVGDAVKEWRHVLDKKPNSVDTRYWLGLALERMGDMDGAKREWQEVLRQQPNHKDAQQALGRLGGDKPETLDKAGSEGIQKGAPPLPHNRIMVNLGNSGYDVGLIDVLSRNVLDYTFGEAPTDWYVASGEWGTTNRWTCSPQWSWFGGIAEIGPVAMWNKHVFAGDITVDMYVAFGMIYGYQRGHYKNPNDLNISVCGDGVDLFSGYTFVVGGWQNHRTAILKKGQVLAQTEETWALPPILEDHDPGTYEHHRKWWGIRARKTGNRLQLYFDNRLAVEAVDPLPLEEGRVALWGYDNRLIVSRVRIYYEELKDSDVPLPPEKWATRQRLATEEQAAPELKVPVTLGNDFQATTSPLKARANSFTQLTLAAPGSDGGGRCLKIINNGPGGIFGLDIVSQPVDLVKLPALSFDYQITPEAKVNLYAVVNDKLYEIVFNGLSDPAALAQVIGRVPDVKADGEWHHAQIDLLGMVRRATGAWTADSLVAKEIWFGNLNERDYLTAGLGGNKAGTTWSLDNVFLYRPDQKAIVSLGALPQGKQIKGVAWEVDQEPRTDPKREAGGAGEKEVGPGKSGWWWVHAATQLTDETWLPTAHAQVPIDTEAPQPRLVTPQAGSAAGDEDIVIALDDRVPGVIDWRTLSVTVAGKALKPGQTGVTVEPELNRVTVDPGEAGLVFQPGEPVAVEVAVGDVAGNQLSGGQRWSFTYAPEKDKRGPRVAKVTVGRPYLVDADFEKELPPLESYSGEGGAVLTLDPTTGASGRGSLRLSNPTEHGRFGVRLVTEPFDAGVYRLVSFDYRVPPHYRGDFAVYVNGDWKAVRFTDSDANIGYMGKIDNVVADGQWHHAEFDLYEMLVKADPRASGYIVRWFVLSDWGGRMANYRRRDIWLDNLQIIPVTSGLEPLKVAVEAGDAGGVAGVSWVLDQLSGTVAPKGVVAESVSFEVPAPGNGTWWFHCKAVDKAGNQSRSMDRRVLLDGERPAASPVGPAAESRAAASEVSLALWDRGIAGIDPGSVVLEVGGKAYTCENAGLVYDAEKKQLIWNCEKVQPEPVVFNDGTAVNVRLVKAADYAGNQIEEHPAWSWTMDYKMDHTPPPIGSIESPTHKTFITETFESGLGQWQAGGSPAKVELDTTNPADGKAAVKLTQTIAGALMQAYACTSTFYAEAYPIIAFDYNFQPGVHLDLMLLCNGNWYALAMTDDPAGAIGRVANIVADGKWRHASVNVFPLLRRQIQRGSLEVSRVLISDRNSADNNVGAVAMFDNFVIGQLGSGTVKLAWRATDATGIQGYSYVIDRKGATEPDAQPETTERGVTLSKLDTGLWYLHVRAQDGAGNWGPASHYAILNGSAD